MRSLRSADIAAEGIALQRQRRERACVRDGVRAFLRPPVCWRFLAAQGAGGGGEATLRRLPSLASTDVVTLVQWLGVVDERKSARSRSLWRPYRSM